MGQSALINGRRSMIYPTFVVTLFQGDLFAVTEERKILHGEISFIVQV
jgi:hypothetical protein